MSSQDSKNAENLSKRDAQKKRARRTRKDEDGRDYVCSCGKSYLSYPALYTHIKTKHDGKAPIKPNQQQDKVVMKQDLQQLKILLSKFYPERLRHTPINQLIQYFSPQQKQYIAPSLFYWQNQQKSQKIQPEKKTLLSAKQSFSKFIYDMNKRVNPNAIKFLVKLMILIEKGVCAEKKNQKYCEQSTASLVPGVFNQLILNGHIAIQKDATQKIMQDNEAICKVLVYFANWLFNQKYTNYSVKYRL